MIVFAFPQDENLAQRLSREFEWDLGEAVFRHFPDGESQVRLASCVSGREVCFVCSLAQPDEKFLPLYFAAKIAKELGARRVGLVAPYLAYMRQDQRFQPGEGISAQYFAALLCQVFDWLITVDPHLHRIDSLDRIYSIPTLVLHAAPLLSQWINSNIKNPLLIGPDQESEQWVSKVAQQASSPFIVLEKKRLGDRQVEISLPESFHFDAAQIPVLVDDIISTAQTMIQAIRQIKQRTSAPPVCVGVHAVFGGEAYSKLLDTGARVITCNTIAHPSNGIDWTPLAGQALKKILFLENRRS